MSRAFQSAFVRLVSDPDYRDGVRAQGSAALDNDPELTPLERRRLVDAAMGRGVEVMRKLHKGFRLSKLLVMMPVTCRELGTGELARHAGRFWRDQASASFSYLDEAEAFGRYLAECMRKGELRGARLARALEWERAGMAARRGHICGTDDYRAVHASVPKALPRARRRK